MCDARWAFAFAILVSFLTLRSATAQPFPDVTPGFPNVPQTAGQPLSGLIAPEQGRTAILAYHNGILFSVPEVPSSQPGADFQVRTWSLSDPTQPQLLTIEGQTPMPINAHGYLKSGDYLVLGSNWPPGSEWSFQATAPLTVERGPYPDLMCAGVRGCLFDPWFVTDTYWSYGEVEGDATLSLRGAQLASWDHLGTTGVIGHPFLVGDLLIFASDQSRTGVATYDVSDPTNPVLLDVLTEGGAGGYWPELWGGDGKLYVVFPYRSGGNGMRVVDATDPTDLRFVADVSLPGAQAMYAQFQDEYAFIGDHKVDMRTFQSVLNFNSATVERPGEPGVYGMDISQFALPIGNLLIGGGVGVNEGMSVWAHQSAPDTRGPSVGFHIPQAGRSGYPVGAPITLLIHETLETPTIVNGLTFIVRPLGGSAIDGKLTFAFDDILTFTPDLPLDADTTYEVVLPAGGIKDAAGNGIDAFSFTFSTGVAVGGNQPPVITSFAPSTWPVAPNASITLAASADDPESAPLEYRFDLGDGSPRTAWTSSTSALASYASVGHYQAVVQVRDPEGAIASRTAVVTVTSAPPAELPTRSSPIACDDATRRVFAVNPDNDTVAALDADGLGVVWERPVCSDPRQVAVSASGELWVTCHDEDAVSVLSPSGDVLLQLATGYGSAPFGVATTPDGAQAFVSLFGSGELARFDTATRAETGRVTLGPRPRALAISSDGAAVYVSRFLSPRDWAEVWEVDAATLTFDVLELRKIGGDLHHDGTAEGRGTPNQLAGLALSPDGGSLWIAATKPNVERGLLIGPDLDQDNTVRNIVLQYDLAAGDVARSIDIDNSDSASAIAFSSLGDYLLVTLQGNNQVLVLDALAIEGAEGLGSLVTRLGASFAPTGVCVDPTTNRTFSKNFMARSVTALETDGLFRHGTIAVSSSEVVTAKRESLAAEVLLGKRVFYDAGDLRMSAEGYMSCATCHLDGGHDGRTWDFTGRGEGLRNTTALAGRQGTAHGNVHWTGNFDEIQDFENDIRGAFGGAGFLSDVDFAATSAPLGPSKIGLSEELDALAAYVTSLGRASLPRSPHREPNGENTPGALNGAAVFSAQGCPRCHAGGTMTDSLVGSGNGHDVGTLRTTSGGRLGGPLGGIDTPTLLGLWDTAPYLHDGSATTLEEVFTTAGGQVIAGETGSVAGGAYIVTQYTEINNDDTVRGRSYARLSSTDSSVAFDGVDGGSGGIGEIELRYSGGVQDVLVLVNGMGTLITLAETFNFPGWRQTNWATARIPGLVFAPGAANTVEIIAKSPYPNVGIDEILISTPDDLAAAAPHRIVNDLTTGERSDLLAYLRELDGRNAGPAIGGGFQPKKIKVSGLDDPPGEQKLKIKTFRVDASGESYDVAADQAEVTLSIGGSTVASFTILGGDPGWRASARRLSWRALLPRSDGLVALKLPAAGNVGSAVLRAANLDLASLTSANRSRIVVTFTMGTAGWQGVTTPCGLSKSGAVLKCR